MWARVIATPTPLVLPIDFPSATILITGHNISRLIPQKLDNLATLEYLGNLSVLFVLDGCTDDTQKIVEDRMKAGYPFNLGVSVNSERNGKEAALLNAIPKITSEVLIFSDADAMMQEDTVQHLINRLVQPGNGAVSGHEIHIKESETGASEGQGLFYQYEEFLKRSLSKFSSLCYVQGGNFAMWKRLYPIENKVPLGATQDGIIAFDVVLSGNKVALEQKAITKEVYELSNSEDFARRVRTISRAFYAICCRPKVLNPFKHNGFAIHLITGRLLRWLTLPIAVLALILGLGFGPSWYKSLLLFGTLIWSVIALIGWKMEKHNKRNKLFYFVFYFTYIHIAAAWAVLKAIMGHRTAVWKPSSQ